ncbi:hypothetical protein HWV62_9765 [Athelia sp. TMB]|nr:hypothetical protein HWV62_9765 [Athelia sp. TMB]
MSGCARYVRYEGSMTVIGIEIVGVMMLLRIRALYSKKWWVSALVAFVLLGETATNIYLLMNAIPVPHPSEVHSCTMIFNPKLNGGATSASAWIPLLYDTLILALTLHRTMPAIRHKEAGDIIRTIFRVPWYIYHSPPYLLLLTPAMSDLSGTQQAVVWYPPANDIRVDTVPIPTIEETDDAIVKITLAGLCGSDLHVYRGHGEFHEPMVMGHEFIGEVVALGDSFTSESASKAGRPALYNTLKVGEKVVAPFTVSCGECHYCRVGFTCRCPSGRLFGTPTCPGGQAQYIRVPKAGGTLYSLSNSTADFWATLKAQGARPSLADSSLLLMCDILPTGVFAAFQALNHPKVLPMVTGLPYPASSLGTETAATSKLTGEDQVLTIAVIGLGPVGLSGAKDVQCACVSLLDMLATRKLAFKIVAIDLVEDRRKKMETVYAAIDVSGKGSGEFITASPDEAKDIVKKWTNGVGCNTVLEVVGHVSALTLAYDLVRSFGAITSVGVHGAPNLPFTGRQMYAKNVSLDFGRCPVRAMFPMALEILVKRQDVFGGVGTEVSLVDKVVGLSEAAESYRLFDKNLVGKVLFDPWRA